MPPLVSVIMPVFNREAYLERTLNSILAQSFQSFELIIADDGSTDRTVDIAESYASRDHRVHVVRLPHSGEVAARNQAFALTDSSSRYILNHDSDDISSPDKLEKLVAYLERHTDIAIVGCLAEYIDDSGEKIGQPHLEIDPERIRATFHQTNSMVNSAALIRREIFEEMGGYREEYRSVDDYDFFARALMAGYQLSNIPEVLHQIRLHQTSISNTRRDLTRLLVARISADYQYFLSTRDAKWTQKLLRYELRFRAKMVVLLRYRYKRYFWKLNEIREHLR